MMRNTLKSVTGERTVPAIFICGEPVSFSFFIISVYIFNNIIIMVVHKINIIMVTTMITTMVTTMIVIVVVNLIFMTRLREAAMD